MNHKLIVTLSYALFSSTIFSANAASDSAPYDYDKYQNVLDDSKLQAPYSTTLIDQGDFEDEYNDYFYVPSSGNKWMTFEIGPYEKMRSELRQMDEWYVDDDYHLMSGKVYISEKGSADEITVMQIHDVTDNDDAINKPLVRIAWMEKQKETGSSDYTEDAYFAILYTCDRDCTDDDAEVTYYKYALADFSDDDAIEFEIEVEDNKLTILVDGVAHDFFDEYDVSYWEELESYFKAGAYIQSDTDENVEVQFESLEYFDEEQSETTTYVQMLKGDEPSFAIDGNYDGDDGQDVYLWTATSSNTNQHWLEIDQGNGYYSYQKRDTEYCLDGGNDAEEGQNVYLWSCDDNNENQLWYKVDLGDDTYRLEKYGYDFSIDGNNGAEDGQSIYLWNSSDSNENQQWIFNYIEVEE